MMKFTSLLHRESRRGKKKEVASGNLSAQYESTVWKDSTSVAGVSFCVRRMSLRQRIEFICKVKQLTLKNEYLNAGNDSDQIEATLADLHVQELYLSWGLVAIAGMTIDGQIPSVEVVIEKGPETLAKEMVQAIHAELGLSENERKNS